MPKLKWVGVWLLPVLLLSGAAQAEIYRSVDARGNVTFSDTPKRNAERVNLPPLSIIPGMNPEDIARANQVEARQTRANRPVRYQVSFSSPAAGQVLIKPQDTLEVAVNTDVPLAAGDRIVVSLAGRALGESASIATEGLDRGEHMVVARVLSEDGRMLGESSVSFVVQQPSSLAPNRRKP
ncbi:MAG: DUF4124 domain-containing protein [Moraxellaceae bacterium]